MGANDFFFMTQSTTTTTQEGWGVTASPMTYHPHWNSRHVLVHRLWRDASADTNQGEHRKIHVLRNVGFEATLSIRFLWTKRPQMGDIGLPSSLERASDSGSRSTSWKIKSVILSATRIMIMIVNPHAQSDQSLGVTEVVEPISRVCRRNSQLEAYTKRITVSNLQPL